MNWNTQNNYRYSSTDKGVNIVTVHTIAAIVFVVWCVIAVFVYNLAIAPYYRVWQQEMQGKAEFAKAEQDRKIKVEEAKANLEAEKLNAQAEVERAKGAAEAIKIENGTITPQYVQYLWVRQQNNLNNNTVIYIPTQGNMPLFDDYMKGLDKHIKSEVTDEK